ncbi:hypothetical protein K450DRAFT_282539 [Umbelopsis ramanniana AG]|uniref:Uncharacterized protein n=1 Tax=Umbelopsis ramanniana AG TaxID=1314678 RepID=A0AAD5E6Y4_UMBRA|nr:uncharacterized protein K450DRAFT_282539 [Umbelopsis ramanniana AG]KAI8577445.1 hypothetical protein K450DRAFT_282539 [Umbelopsis ramanniana AG]
MVFSGDRHNKSQPNNYQGVNLFCFLVDMQWNDPRLQVTMAITATALTVGGIVYYLTDNHQKTLSFNHAKKKQRSHLQTLAHIEKDIATVERKIDELPEGTTAEAFSVRECNELLIQYLERLDAVIPNDIRHGEFATAKEQEMINKLKTKKRGLIKRAQRNFNKLDTKVSPR